MSGTISASDMQRLNPSIYPSDIPNLTSEFNLSHDQNMWASVPTTNTVNPSFISGANNMQPAFPLSFSNIPGKQFDHRRRSAAEAQFGHGLTNSRVHHGQFTPPSDNSPPNPALSFHADDTKSYLRSSIEGSSEAPSKRRRASTRTTRSGSARTSASAEPSSPGDDKQEKTRARNRLAASKCRQKKKEQNNQLESKYEYEKIRNEELIRTVNSLRDAIVEAKDQLLAHSECGHDSIKAYIQGMAKKITVHDDRLGAEPFPAHYYGCGPPTQKHESIGFEFDACPPTA